MKEFQLLLLLCLCGLNNSIAQPDKSQKLNLEGLSRAEIRQIFLNSQSGTDLYNLAEKSKSTNRSGIILLSVGGLFAIGGIYSALAVKNSKNLEERIFIPLASITSFSLSLAFLISGEIKRKKSKDYLKEAIELYKRK